MAAVIGPASGVLVAAAVYYTISSTINTEASSIRSQLHSTAISISDEAAPPAPPVHSSLVGPSYPPPRPFGDLLRTSWNNTIASAVRNVGDVEWSAVGSTIVSEAQALTAKLQGSSQVQHAQAVVDEKVAEVKEKAVDMAERVKQDKREDVRVVEEKLPERRLV